MVCLAYSSHSTVLLFKNYLFSLIQVVGRAATAASPGAIYSKITVKNYLNIHFWFSFAYF